MHASYDDITSRIGSPPIWFDEYAVPRYCTFEPSRSASAYIDEIALVEIACQHCAHPLHVACSRLNFAKQTIADAIQSRALHYGDPPRHTGPADCPDDCFKGACMSSEPRRVLEYWRRHDPRYLASTKIIDKAYFEWIRDPLLEVEINLY